LKEILMVNLTKGTKIGKVEVADSFFSRFRGLMLRKKVGNGMLLKLPQSRSRHGSAIHMFFMRFPLDIVFADSDGKIVDMVTVDPWKTYTPRAPAKYVIELEKGSIKKFDLELGDDLDFTLECV
jgi:uncharacterized membrane protein (UPF0127 family)